MKNYLVIINYVDREDGYGNGNVRSDWFVLQDLKDFKEIGEEALLTARYLEKIEESKYFYLIKEYDGVGGVFKPRGIWVDKHKRDLRHRKNLNFARIFVLNVRDPGSYEDECH